ncbi:sugar ABC transporter ATP-binding protein [Lysinibacter sp. HNR]|uniref:sugar ABC transporter ATP-binding protein n=1 Tax=Lysinibacter sp. HNR TaxID=3031408 RepID=UPI002434F476|nr:sugar ABC transporter ATP-binding protein [Lysinibacter sp. HNR]WGD37692.1 sugar ABC transporter ATP-binding protein [Lysinibacter sp. HNR]
MSSPTVSPPALELREVAKSFGSVVALRSGNIVVDAGSIHALVGENGAGKSTLVKIVAGLYQRDEGVFRLSGRDASFKTTADSKAAGVAVIYQEPTLFPDLSVTENIFMGRQPTNRFGRIDRRAMREEAIEIFERLGVRIDPDRLADGLSIADQQIIEIAKAISLKATVLIMDEPTAALSGVEAERLFAVARSLRDEGRALVFISHRFDEVFDLCDIITVMRDGEYISTVETAHTSVEEIVRLMVGRDVTDLFPKEEVEAGDTLLQVQGLTSAGMFEDISFSVRAGEIVGLAGLVGAGRSEVARAVFGVDNYDRGTVALRGTTLKKHSVTDAMRAGLALIPEDRRKQGLVLDFPVGRNITLAIRNRLASRGILTAHAENKTADGWASTLQVKTAALSTRAGTLSGGNQQKVVIAKWLATQPHLLIIDEPTRGIDVGTKSEVHRLLSKLAGEGMGILMISSELPEVLGMADRVLVMREGRLTAELSRDEATAETVMLAATQSAGDMRTGETQNPQDSNTKSLQSFEDAQSISNTPTAAHTQSPEEKR